jgi:hypothetical protein
MVNARLLFFDRAMAAAPKARISAQSFDLWDKSHRTGAAPPEGKMARPPSPLRGRKIHQAGKKV